MQVVEEQIVAKLRTLSDKEREDVLSYLDRVISGHERKLRLGEKLAALFADLPDEVLERMPKDGSAQHDHYIYGTPKR